MSSLVIWHDDVVNVEVAWAKHAQGAAPGFVVTWYHEGASPETSYPAGSNAYREKADAERFGRRKSLELHAARASGLLRGCGEAAAEPVTGVEARRSGNAYALASGPGSPPFAEGMALDEAARLLGLLSYAAVNARDALVRMAFDGDVPADAEGLDDLPGEARARVMAAASLARRDAMRLVKGDMLAEASEVPVRAVSAWLAGRPLQAWATPRP